MEETAAKSLEFRMGELTAGMSSLVASNGSLSDTIRRLEDNFEKGFERVEARADDASRSLARLEVKMSFIGFIGGIVGAAIAYIFQQLFLKKF